MNADEQRVAILAACLARKRDYDLADAEMLVRHVLETDRRDDDYDLSSLRAWIAWADTKEAAWQAVRPVAEPVLNWLLLVTRRMKIWGRR